MMSDVVIWIGLNRLRIVEGSYEYSNESSDFIKGGRFLEQLSYYQLLERTLSRGTSSFVTGVTYQSYAGVRLHGLCCTTYGLLRNLYFLRGFLAFLLIIIAVSYSYIQ
jgi:hypothetical protein